MKEDKGDRITLDQLIARSNSRTRPQAQISPRPSGGGFDWEDRQRVQPPPLWLVGLGIVALAAGWCLRPETVRTVKKAVQAAQSVGANVVAPTIAPTTASVAIPATATLLPTAVASWTPYIVYAPTREPTHTPAPTSTAIPLPATRTPLITAPGKILAMTSPWFGNGLRLSIQDPPHEKWSYGSTEAKFLVTNTSKAVMDFAVPLDSFYVEVNGQRFVGHEPNTDVVQFNDFSPGEKSQRDFTISFQIDWKQFQILKANPRVTSYTVGASDFGNGSIQNAQWEYPLSHGTTP